MARIFLAIGVLVALCAVVLGSNLYGLQTLFREAHIPPAFRVDGGRLRAALAATENTARSGRDMLVRTGRITAGNALARAIYFSRQQARGAHNLPLPPHLKQKLEPYFPADTLNKVRWTLAGRRISLGSLLAGWYLREGAVTLEDTLVFSNLAAARDLELWAHELTHVRQYEELGIRDFANLYVEDWATLERQARSNAKQILLDIHRRERAAKHRMPPAATDPGTATGVT